jgi:hypothetical protein
LDWGPPASDRQGMERVAPISYATSGGYRSAGWQQQVRVDYVVNKVMQTHRGRAEDSVKQAINDQLRAVGVVPNGRQIAVYAAAISALPELPPNNN